MLEAYYSSEQLDFKNRVFEDSSSSMVPFADAKVLETFKQDSQFYEKAEMNLTVKECEAMVRFFKT